MCLPGKTDSSVRRNSQAVFEEHQMAVGKVFWGWPEDLGGVREVGRTVKECSTSVGCVGTRNSISRQRFRSKYLRDITKSGSNR